MRSSVYSQYIHYLFYKKFHITVHISYITINITIYNMYFIDIMQSNIMEINLSGKAVIKIPGANSTLDSLKVNGGLGFLEIDMSGWTKSIEQINDYTYQVWTKNDSYASELPHQIQFTLA